jgi:hypothetical protein
MLSYPCGRGEENDPDTIVQRKHTWHPRLDWLKEATDQAGVHLRVVFLYRDVSKLLASSCVHQHYNSCSVIRDVLVSNAQYLTESIKMLDPQECSCFKYGEPEVMDRAMVQAFGKDGAGAIEKVWHPGDNPDSPRKYSDDTDAEPDFQLYLSQLQSTQELLDMACGHCSANAVK